MSPARPILVLLAAALAVKLVAIFATGFCDDEAYVVVISRAPALSFFDHPPLHQWLLEAWTLAFGEGRAARLPFLAAHLVTCGALFGLTRRLFGAAAAWWMLLILNFNAYFLLQPDGYILPDPPLFAFSALAAWAAAEIFFGGRRLWGALGLALGLAGLAKYSAIFVPLGLAGFVLTAQRGWLRRPEPYLAALLALACLTPVWVWNGEHGFVSFAFQSARAAREVTFTLKALGEALAALGVQAAAMTPWMMAALLAGLAQAARAKAGSPERFLLWLAAPALALFALMPFFGQRPIGHWFNSGWLFAFPLAGAWLAQRGLRFQGLFLKTSALGGAALFAAYLGAILGGPLPLGGARDPTREMVDLPAAPIRDVYARSGARFVLVESWRLGGRLGVALGPGVAICAVGDDPRGFAFACDGKSHVGEDGLIVHLKGKGEATGEFEAVEALPDLALGRRGVAERVLNLQAGRRLKRAPELPYGG